MTLADIAQMESNFLTPENVSKVIECEANNIRIQAASQEGRIALGFPIIRIGKVTKIPRIPFLRFMGWEGQIKGAEVS